MAPQVDNLTAVLYKKNDLRLEQRSIPEPKDNEVQLKISCVGICGTDVHFLLHGRLAHYMVENPMALGHEASGVVQKVGKNVKTLKPGDRVAIEPGIGCRTCSYCKEGRYHLCPDTTFCSLPPTNGMLTRVHCHPADFCFKLPDHVSMEEGAMLEPLSVAVHACRTIRVTFGDHVLILGAGPIGLVTLLTAKAMGATKIVVTDVIDHKLQKALDLGATLAINTQKFEGNLTEYLKNSLGGRLPNKTIDCVGAQPTIRTGIEVTRDGGVLCIVGLAASEVTVPISSALTREVNIRGVFKYCNDYPVALEMLASGQVDVKPMITHHYTLEEAHKAFENVRTGAGNAIKIIIHCDLNYQK